MSFPVFASGDVLNASDMNAVGMWRVGGGSFASATTVDITGFSSEYTSYRLVYAARRTDAVGNVLASAQFRSSTTPQASGYYYGSAYSNYLGTTATLASGNNVSSMGFWNPADSFASFSHHSLDIYLAQNVGVTWQGTGYYTGAAYSWFYGGSVGTSLTIDRLRVSYIAPGSVSGEWQLYGYKR